MVMAQMNKQCLYLSCCRHSAVAYVNRVCVYNKNIEDIINLSHPQLQVSIVLIRIAAIDSALVGEMSVILCQMPLIMV